MNISPTTINEKLTKTGRLEHRIIGVYGLAARPAAAVAPAAVIDEGTPCLAKALFKMASRRDVPAICVDAAAAGESCPGMLMWFGLIDFPPQIGRMFGSDSPSDDSFCIKRTGELAAATLRDMGRFTPCGEHIVMRPLADGDDDADGLKSILCFGHAEQLRNLGALIHFGEEKAFAPIVAPWGSGCATFVAFPAGMASGRPADTAFLSPVIPEANSWLPRDIFALSIPVAIARRMAADYDSSFAVRRPDLAYPPVKEKF
jgi:hypothetical protein